MVKRYLRKRLPLTRNQKTISQYFKKSQKPRIRRKLKPKKPSKEDDSSYVLPSNTDETDDFDKIDLEEETIESQINSTVIDLTEDDEPKEKSVKKYPKYPKMKRIIKSSKKRKGRKSIAMKWRRRRNEKKKGENMNSFAELNHCYNKLSDLIAQYNFSDIADVILKLNNGIKKDNSDKNEEILFKEISNLNLVLKNKEDIITMCLSILNSKNSNNNINQDNNTDLDISDHSPEDEETEEKHIKKEKNAKSETKENTMINGFKAMNKDEYIFGIHFYNSTNGVYLYYPVSEEKQQSLALFCKNRDSGCKAKCVVYSNTNDVTMKGIHNHKGEPYNSFCQIHPEFKNKNWEHVQVINENGEDIIIKQC